MVKPKEGKAMVKAKEATTVEHHVARPYRMEIYWDKDYWAAEFPELPGLVAGSETWVGLQEAIDGAKRALVRIRPRARGPDSRTAGRERL